MKNVVGISAEMATEKGDDSIAKFRRGDATILVATYSCSRALNLDVKLVINYDIPLKAGRQFDPKIYTCIV